MEKNTADSCWEFESAGGCTTPAENTGKIPMRALVDWVTCSFKSAFDLHQVFNLIGISDMENMEEIGTSKFAMAGYSVTYRIGMIEYHRNFKEDRWLLNMSGQGCRQYEILSCFDMVTMLGILVNLNTTFTRLDIAIDDFNCYYTTDIFRQAVYNKQCVTRLEDWGNGERGKIAHGRDFLTMDNFYLGGKSSRYYINVYDKKLEREDKIKTAGEEKKKRIQEELYGIDQWTRTEVRFTYEYAEQFVAHILSGHLHLGYYVTSFLNGKIVFLKPSALKLDKNKSRLAKDVKNHARWWKSFVHNASKLHLSVYKPDKMLVESKDWLFGQVSTTLASHALYKPHDFYKLVNDLVADGMQKMKKHHLIKISNQKHFDRLANEAVESYDLSKYPKWVDNLPVLRDLMNIYTDTALSQDASDRRKSNKKSAINE